MESKFYNKSDAEVALKILLEREEYDDFQEDDELAFLTPQEKEEAKKVANGEIELSDDLYEKIFDSNFCQDMPYGTMKARDGDPYEWITEKLQKHFGVNENEDEEMDEAVADLNTMDSVLKALSSDPVEGVKSLIDLIGKKIGTSASPQKIESTLERLKREAEERRGQMKQQRSKIGSMKENESEEESEEDVEQMDEIVGTAAIAGLGALASKLWKNKDKVYDLAKKVKERGAKWEDLGELKDIVITNKLTEAVRSYKRYLKESFGLDVSEKAIEKYLVKTATQNFIKKAEKGGPKTSQNPEQDEAVNKRNEMNRASKNQNSQMNGK